MLEEALISFTLSDAYR